MAHTYYAVHLHLVFSTKERRPWLTPPVREDLFGYLAGTIRGQDSFVHIVGGHVDHVHALLSPGSTVLVPDLVKEVKRASSIWMKEEKRSERSFAWQEGYGVFSVSHSNLGRVRKYIAEQDAHHRERSFEDEFRTLLVKHGVKYDERFYLG